MWMCGPVDMWTRGRVCIWACGHVGVWNCRRLNQLTCGRVCVQVKLSWKHDGYLSQAIQKISQVAHRSLYAAVQQ